MSLKLTVATIKKIAHAHRWEVYEEPTYGYVGYVRFPNGSSTFFRSNSLEVNTTAPLRIAKDKDYAKLFLDQAGVKTPEGKAFYSEKYNTHLSIKRSIEDGYLFAKRQGFPVVLKPNGRSQGVGVYKVYDESDFRTVATELLSHNNIVLVEKFYPGRDYRVVVYRSKVFAVYERQPLTITGDGIQTVQELLTQLSEQVRERKNIPISPRYGSHRRVWHTLSRAGYVPTTILPPGKTVPVLDNANLSAGGFSIDWTEKVHPTYAAIAQKAASAIHLDLAGVDFIAPDITQPASEYVVVEINGNPGIENFMRMGHTQYMRAYRLYEAILTDKSA